MIYPLDAEQRLGFDTVRADIASKIETPTGVEILEAMHFSASYHEVRQSLDRVGQMVDLLGSGEEYVGRGFVDILAFLGRLSIDGTFIEVDQLVALGRALTLYETNRTLFASLQERELFPALTLLFERHEPMGHLVRQIERIAAPDGTIKDSASTELAAIRRKIGEQTVRISRRLQQILAQGQADGYVEKDISISIRDGRAVIPVAAVHKRKIKGLVFDESATGRTAYIEPMEVVELNNEVAELKNEERREIVRILRDFTNTLRPELPFVEAAGKLVCYLDFLTAKARYAQDIGGVVPLLNDAPEVSLDRARHPLLEKIFKKEGKAEQLVPLTIRLSAQKHILLISGPNAGGKSVCLKTVGLLQLMVQSGILVPTGPESAMGLFDSVFIDIGDEQSIENDLSTYSSHLQNMKMVLREATNRSLVLIDEFGGGTEPVVGGAIAEAVLEKLVERRAFGVITTHYSNLKNFAAHIPGIENGAMTFDVQQIKPLYRLEIGRAGSSFAFEIARKIGLPEDVLALATEKAGVELVSLEKQLRAAARDRRYWESKRENIRVANKSTERLAEEYAGELEKLKQERNTLLRAAKDEAAQIIKSANATIEQTIRTIKEAQAEKGRTQSARRKVEELREALASTDESDEAVAHKMALLKEREERRARRSAERAAQPKAEVVAAKPKRLEAEIGSEVRVNGMRGTILELAGGKATVALGDLRSRVDLSKIEVVAAPKKSIKKIQISNIASTVLDTAVRFSDSIDVRGMRVVEGLEEVREFVDRAIVVGRPKVMILHGKGTGALKEEVRRYLKSEPAVSKAYDQAEELGGAGITVVEFSL